MNRLPEPHELSSNDPRSPFFDDGFKPRIQPQFVKELNPGHLKPQEPMRNPNARYKNQSPLKEAMNFQKYIWEGKCE